MRREVERTALQILFDVLQLVLVRSLTTWPHLLIRRIDTFAGQQAIPRHAREVGVEVLAFEFVGDVLAL